MKEPSRISSLSVFRRLSLVVAASLVVGCAPSIGAGDGGDDDGGAEAPLPDAGDPPNDGGPGDDDAGPGGDDAGVAPDGGPPPPPPPTLSVTGTVIDFVTRAELTVSASVSPIDILPPPAVQVTGADFTLTDVAGNSIFRLLVGAVGYRSTFSQPLQVAEADLSAVTVEAASAAFIADAAQQFGVTVAAGTGVVIARAVDQYGAPVEGVPAGAFYVNDAAPVAGPYFLNAQRQPDDALTATSTSGYALFFNVSPGDVTISESPTSSFALASIAAPVDSDTATRLDVRAEAGEFVLPVNVDFATDVIAVFENKGCADCHSGGGVGFDLGNLTLDASPNLIYNEVTSELSPNYGVARVNLADPEASLLLYVPTTGPNIHPIQMFYGYSDPDYLTLLSWITDGAPRD